jgi:hypothetical protein
MIKQISSEPKWILSVVVTRIVRPGRFPMYMMMVTEKGVGICQKKKKMGTREEEEVEE